MGKWMDMAENLLRRDKEQLDAVNSSYCGGMPTDNRLAVAECRAMDALAAVVQVLVYLDGLDK